MVVLLAVVGPALVASGEDHRAHRVPRLLPAHDLQVARLVAQDPEVPKLLLQALRDGPDLFRGLQETAPLLEPLERPRGLVHVQQVGVSEGFHLSLYFLLASRTLARRRPGGLGQAHRVTEVLDLLEKQLWVIGDFPALVAKAEDDSCLRSSSLRRPRMISWQRSSILPSSRSLQNSSCAAWQQRRSPPRRAGSASPVGSSPEVFGRARHLAP